MISAAFWLGAAVMSVFVLLRTGSFSGTEIPAFLLSFRLINRTVLFSLIVTGLYNLFARGYSWFDLADPVFWGGYFGETLMVKLILFSAVLISSVIIDLAIAKIIIETGEKNEELWRRRLSLALGLNLIFGAAILFCAIMLVRGRPW